MSNNKSMQILRGTNARIAVSTDTLLPGQLLYNYDKNYITVGGKDSNTRLNSAPVVARELIGYLGDTGETIGAGTQKRYRVGVDETGEVDGPAFNVDYWTGESTSPFSILSADQTTFTSGRNVIVDPDYIFFNSREGTVGNVPGNIVIGSNTTIYDNTDTSDASKFPSIAIGRSTEVTAEKVGGCIALGADAHVTREFGIAVGHAANATAENAIQLGSGTNSIANTLQFRGRTVVDAAGKINADTATVATDYAGSTAGSHYSINSAFTDINNVLTQNGLPYAVVGTGKISTTPTGVSSFLSPSRVARVRVIFYQSINDTATDVLLQGYSLSAGAVFKKVKITGEVSDVVEATPVKVAYLDLYGIRGVPGKYSIESNIIRPSSGEDRAIYGYFTSSNDEIRVYTGAGAMSYIAIACNNEWNGIEL